MVFMAVTGFAVARLRNLFGVVMLTGLFSLMSAVLYVVLDAVDVAFTEAAVGAGISTILLLGTLALFRAEQSNLAESAGLDPATGQTLYNGIDVVSEGVEFEITGRLAEGLLLQAGLTHLSLEDGNDGKGRGA